MDMPQLHYRRFWLALGWLLVGAVIYLSLTPHPPHLPNLAFGDKLGHVGAYLLLMAWFCQIVWSFPRRAATALSLAGLGVILEFFQGWGGHRFFEYADMLANGLGVLAGWGLAQTPAGRWLARLDERMRRASPQP